MSFYTSEQILNQALDSATGTLKTSGPSGAASATAANQTTTNDRLGTPGTGEPAHAGGSTGLIGWARDILASQDTAVYYVDTTTPLAANATFTGSDRAMAAGNSRFTADFYADRVSASVGARIENIVDSGVAYLPVAGDGVDPGIALQLTVIRTTGSYRVFYANGATAQTSLFRISSSQTPN